ncbi:10800_t:CDS:2, partial [Paraglomus occultum]
ASPKKKRRTKKMEYHPSVEHWSFSFNYAKRFLGNLKEANGRSVDCLQKETSIELKKAADVTFRNTPSRGRRLFVPQLSPGTIELVTWLSISDNKSDKSDDERTFWLTPPVNSITKDISWVAKPPAGCRLTDYLNYMPTGIPAYVTKKLKIFNFIEQFEICRFFRPFGYSTELDSYAIPKRGFNSVWTLMEGANVDQ